MEDLKVAYLQQDIVWNDKQKNFENIENILSSTTEQFDLLVLPEVFATGFGNDILEMAEPIYSDTYMFMSRIAQKYSAVVVGSCFCSAGDDCYNRLYWVFPDGQNGYYDKRHLFRIGSEYKMLQKGTTNQVFEIKGWKVAPFICYDLRFPVWMRNSFNDTFAYDLALVVASWPARRANVWKQLLVARAIENMSYVVGVNRIGKDIDGVEFVGDSRVVDFKGTIIDEIEQNKEQLKIVTLSHDYMSAFRTKMPFYLDWDNFDIK